MKIEVINRAYTDITRHKDPDEYWDADDTVTSNHIEGIRLAENGKYYDLDTDFPVKPGKEYYLLHAIYDTGDSFGRYGGQISYILLYKTLDKALDAQHTLEGVTNEFSKVIKTESGKSLTYSIPWTGYFESLDRLDIEVVKLDTSYEATEGY